jgi:peroxiredoxin
MTARLAVVIFTVAVALLAVSHYRVDFSSKENGHDIAREALFTKLGVEPLHKKGLAPDFTLKDPSGASVNLRSLKGKVVFLNFWAAWCPSCKLEMPAMEELHREFGGRGLVILAVNFQESPEEIGEFLRQNGLTFITPLDRKSEVFQLYQAWSLPTTYIIDKDGEIVGRITGYRDWNSDSARALFRHLLEDQA